MSQSVRCLGNIVVCNPLDQQHKVEDLTGSNQLYVIFHVQNGWHESTKKKKKVHVTVVLHISATVMGSKHKSDQTFLSFPSLLGHSKLTGVAHKPYVVWPPCLFSLFLLILSSPATLACCLPCPTYQRALHVLPTWNVLLLT